MDGGIAEAALIGAAIGGGTSAMRGQDPLKGAMMGGLMGGVGGGISGLMGSGAGAAAAPVVTEGVASPALTAAGLTTPTAASAGGDLLGTGISGLGAPTAQTPFLTQGMQNIGQDIGANALAVGPSGLTPTAAPAAAIGATPSVPTATTPSAGFLDTAKDWWGGLTPGQKLMTGGGLGLGAMMMSDSRRYGVPGQKPYTGPLSQFSYSPSYYRPSLAYAEGGITDLGGYSDGGRLLRGPGDGVSDSIPATIEGKQPARLADGEFVVPARVVSELGNGSTDAGAKKLYDMMHRVQKARKKTIGKKSLAIDSKADNFLPA